MKTEILKKDSIVNTWNEPKLLIAANGLVVLSSGKHSDFTFTTFNEKITLEND